MGAQDFWESRSRASARARRSSMFSASSLAIYAMGSWCLATRLSTSIFAASEVLTGVSVLVGCDRSIVKKYSQAENGQAGFQFDLPWPPSTNTVAQLIQRA